MKKILLLAMSIALFTSCEIHEEITFNKDGSGEYQMSIDMSAMMAMGKDSKKQKKDSLSPKKKPVVQDTIYKFSDILTEKKDSIARLSEKEQKILNELKDVIVKIHMDETKDEMTMAYVYPFQKISDLKNIQERLEKINKNSKEKEQIDNFLSEMPRTTVEYKFSNRKFRRKVRVLKTEKKDDEKENTENQTGKMDKLYTMFRYKLIYHFPKKIKSVSYKDAMLSADGKTLIIELPFNKIAENPELLDFEVKF